MFRRFVNWLGPARSWALFMILGGTGAISLVLQAVGTEVPWVIPVQNGLFLAWMVSSVAVIISAMDPLDRRPLLISVAPAILGVALALLVPVGWPWFLGAGVGWLVLSQIILRRNVRREYQQAIRHLRKSEYSQAIKIMTELINAEPKDSAHYRFRAELHRLQGNPSRALKDYQRMVQLEPDSGVGYNGLAEVYLQQQDYQRAHENGLLAFEREPDQWVMPYNLGMIEDRMGLSEQVIDHLQRALTVGIPEGRHRLLVYLWLARAYARLDRHADLDEALAALRREKRGLSEWQTIFESEQAATLREVLADDVAVAQRLADGAGAEILQASGTLTGAMS